MLGLEARGHAEQPLEAADHQRRADDGDDGERNLSGHEDLSHARASGGDVPAPLPQPIMKVVANGVQHRSEAEEKSGGNGDRECVREHSAVDREPVGARQIGGRSRRQQSYAADRKEQPERSSRECQYKALGEQLSHDPGAPCTERLTN